MNEKPNQLTQKHHHMKIIRTIIIEDEPKAKVMLHSLLERYCEEVQVIGTASNVQEGVALIKQLLPDLVFLDIEMPEEKGLHLFKYFDDLTFEVIFTTAYDEYAINALRLSALDYLLKPVDLKELKTAISNYYKKQDKQQLYRSFYQQYTTPVASSPKRLALPSKDNFTFLEVEDIMYCLADTSYTIFVDRNAQKHIVSKSIKEYAEMLESLGFVRVHRSSIINLAYVKSLARTRPCYVVMKNGQEIRVAQSRRQFLIDTLTQL